MESENILPFSTDGCSMFPDGSFQAKTLWQTCCIEHDKAYWRGGTYAERKAADKALKECVANVGQPKIAKLMLHGVRIGGSPYWYTPFRWGYGWPYLRGYKALTQQELLKVEAMAYSLAPSFYRQKFSQESQINNQTNSIFPAVLMLVNNFNQYQVVLVSLPKKQEYCDILAVYKEEKTIVIKFAYRGISKLTLTTFAEEHGIATGSYLISLLPVFGKYSVHVKLKFATDGTADGYWTNAGFKGKFNIIKK